MRKQARRYLILLTLVALLTTGCGVRAIDMPLPGTAVSGDTYRVSIEFASALNLPEKAKVFVDGVEVGMVDTIGLEGRTAVINVQIRRDVQLSTRTQASIRQSSLLGDLFVDLSVPQEESRSLLRDGGRIPIGQTVPADNVEDMLRSMSMFVLGAPTEGLARMVNEVNASFPPPAELDSLRRFGMAALHELADSRPVVERLLASSSSIVATVGKNAGRVDFLLQNGPPRTAGLADVLFGVVDLMFGMAHLTKPITPLLKPNTPELRRMIGILKPMGLAVAYADYTVPQNLELTNSLLRDKLVPFFSSPLNVRVRTDKPATAQADQMIGVLRAIGMVR
ncbi:Mce family protein [Gordonia araii NBRC 100433]|uniref:Mce family protein n=1 Tax=Gordonia araii NBRC 100433 TaxID=1073574 RepID=G7GXB4_9ACTN|nr:MlaD family protein [Gordonia araii]NNG99012.1 MCE family protein [Gordonia araii NBRC 100433]GAB08239.1 Mce family protein [Gordonia araii NBRC 100433]